MRTTAVISRRALRACLLLIVFGALVACGGPATYRVNGKAMEPTLHEGQGVSVDRTALAQRQPQRGDVVILHPPTNRSAEFVKRVIGLPGETVAVRRGEVLIDGTALSEPYVHEAPAYTVAPVLLRADQYFVLGDNRNDSADSHVWGPVTRQDVFGLVILRAAG